MDSILTERERLTLYYDSVEELGRLACFQRFFFFSPFFSLTAEVSPESSVCIAFTPFLREENQKAITHFKGFRDPAEKRDDTKNGQQKIELSFLWKKYQNFACNVDYSFSPYKPLRINKFKPL